MSTASPKPPSQATKMLNDKHDVDASGARLEAGPGHGQEAPSPRRAGAGWIRTTYDAPAFQVFLVGVICFLTPGLFNALSGIGGGGQLDNTISEKANIALYSTFATVSFFSGSIHNKLGTRPTLWAGTLGYALYAASFLSYNINANAGFVIAAGAILGFCASLVWCAQGAVMMSYPTERDKGKMIALFWAVFNLGAVIGSVIELGLAQNNQANTVNNGTYAAFVVLMFLGSCVTWLLKRPDTVVRADGSRVVVPPHMSWKREFQGLLATLRQDPWILLLFPMFFASNFFYTWQLNAYNGVLFTLRTRALNSMLYWLAQMLAALALGLLLDSTHLSRKRRAWIGWALAFVLVWAVWGGSYAKGRQYTRESVSEGAGYVRVDYARDPASVYAPLCILYILSGAVDAVWQCLVYYLLGAVSNDLGKLAALAGFYKALQSAGAATAFGIDVALQPYLTLLAMTWALCVVGLLAAVPVIHLRITKRTVEKRVGGAGGEKGEGVVVVVVPALGAGTRRSEEDGDEEEDGERTPSSRSPEEKASGVGV